MLLSAVQQRSDSVFLDLLTFADLEMLQARKAGAAPGSMSASSAPFVHHNKRYLILTYRVEYDRVHYPLPLAFEEVPTTATLQRVIRRLRTSLAQEKEATRRARDTSDDGGVPAGLRDAHAEIAALKDRLVEMAEQRSALEETLHAETQARASAEATLDKLRSVTKTELRRLRRALACLLRRVCRRWACH